MVKGDGKKGKMLAAGGRLLLRISFFRNALREKAGLAELKGKISIKVKIGVALMLFSYLLNWPFVTVLGALSFYFGEAEIVVMGGPVAFIGSHLIFMVGLILAGGRYAPIICRWAGRIIIEKMLS